MRLSPPERNQLASSDAMIYDTIAASRSGHVRGPFAVWMTVPAIAAGASMLADALRSSARLSSASFETAVLLCARFWRADYPWAVHEHLARAVGVKADTIHAVRAGTRPEAPDPVMGAVWDVVSALLWREPITDELYASATEALGAEGLVELVTVVGFYSTACMVSKFYDVEAPTQV